MYYGLIVFSVLLFSLCFALSDEYRKARGSGFDISLESSLLGALAGFAVLLVFNRFQIEFTFFTLLVAFLASLNSIAFMFCSFKALDTVNLSLFSLFSMLGGMVLPFLQGIVFYRERLTLGKILCLLLICAALCLTVSKGEKRKGTVYYAGVFLLNGMSGVLSKLFTSAPFEKTSSLVYSIWTAACTAIMAGMLLWVLTVLRKRSLSARCSPKAFVIGASGGAINRVANLILLLALAHVDASVQYPMVTGGVMIASTLLCFFGPRKPSKREIASVALAFLGLLTLFVMPI